MSNNLIEIFGGEFTPPQPVIKHTQSPDTQLITAMVELGLEPPSSIVFDGNFHRFGRKKSSWYVAFSGDIHAGKFGDWREGMESTWRQDIGRDISAIEQMRFTTRMAEAKKIRDAEIALLRENAAHQAAEIWETAQLASDDHPYLLKKRVPNMAGLRVAPDGRLIAPIYINGELSSLQYIDSVGGKLMLKGGKSGGGYWHIGALEAEIIYVAEGVATAISIHQATGATVVVAFSANNLPSVVKTIKAKLNITQRITVVADNDESGTGEKYAKECGVPYIVMPTLGDANDYVNNGGDLSALLNPQKSTVEPDWLVNANDFATSPAPIKWFIKHWIQRDALIMVHGPSGGGKTFVVLDWCLRAASGMEEWAGNKVHPANVVYLAGEGHHGLRGRIAAWKQQHKPDNISMWLSRGGCDLNTPEGYNKVVDHVNALPEKPDLIVVDTLHRFLKGDENSAQDAKTMLDACNWLMDEFTCSVLLVHHTGVSEDTQHRARGSSAWRGALDIEISVSPATASKPMELIQRKSKDAELAESLFVQLETVTIEGWIDEDKEPVTSAIPVVSSEKPSSVKTFTPAQALFIRAYRTAADCGRGIYAAGQFVGVDEDVIRDYYYEFGKEAGTKVKTINANFHRAKSAFTMDDVDKSGNCWYLKLIDLTICQADWDAKSRNFVKGE